MASAMGAFSALSLTAILSSCNKKDEDDKPVSPPEDLMQEHGLLNRVLLIYDTCKAGLIKGERLDLKSLYEAAGVIKTFVEDYHEKQEENYLFPRFQKAGQLTGLVQTLLSQHQAGRQVTAQIIHLSKRATFTENEQRKLIDLLGTFNTVYRPHEAREDTVLFPAFRKIVSKHEYAALGEEFENNEQKLFGEDGFESMVAKVAAIEKELGIYDLSRFTPKGEV